MDSRHELRVDIAQIAMCESHLETMETELAALEAALGAGFKEETLPSVLAELRKIREACALTRGILADMMTYDKEAGSLGGAA